MERLKTSFAGLLLDNPIIVSSCGLTNKAENNERLAKAGAGGIVLKSLFEEQIMREVSHFAQGNGHSEGDDLMAAYLRAGMLNEYLELISESKSRCDIPVIASINCNGLGEWTEFAASLEDAGADAVELNVMGISTGIDYRYGEFEQRHIDILKAVRGSTDLPIIMKLGNNLSNPVHLIDQLYAYGASGVVLFNRFYHPDIDTERMEFTPGYVFSDPSELSNALRWTGIASATVRNIGFAVSGGVQDGNDVIKSILTGASAVEVCSALYKNGPEWIGCCLRGLDAWMEKHGYDRIESFRGRMNAGDAVHAERLERTQFLKYFGLHE